MAIVIIYRHLRKQEDKSKRAVEIQQSNEIAVYDVFTFTHIQALVESDHLTSDCTGYSVVWSALILR